MKHLLAVLLFVLSSTALAGKHVDGYTRKDGTYVQGYTRSIPDKYRYNNYNSESNGGNQRDEYSTYGATNKSNSNYGSFDNDKDGISNPYDSNPESARGR